MLLRGPICTIVLVCALGLGCASATPSQSSYRFFTQPEPERDPWYEQVERWQEREREDLPGATLADAIAVRQAGPYSGLLRVTMGRWESRERLALAKRLAKWAQGESRRHYRFDPITSQADDPWPTTKDLLETSQQLLAAQRDHFWVRSGLPILLNRKGRVWTGSFGWL